MILEGLERHFGELEIAPASVPSGELSRQTGRTQRMLLAVWKVSRKNPDERVVVVAHSARYAADLSYRYRVLLSKFGDPFKVTQFGVNNVRFESISRINVVRLGSRGRRRYELWDHHAGYCLPYFMKSRKVGSK